MNEIESLRQPICSTLSADLPEAILANAESESGIAALAEMLGQMVEQLPSPARHWLQQHAVREAEMIVRGSQQRRALRIQNEWRDLHDEDRSRWQRKYDDEMREYSLAVEAREKGHRADQPKRPCSAYFAWVHHCQQLNS